jgi:hypothetical protein
MYGSINKDTMESTRWQIEESTVCKATLVIFDCDCLVIPACTDIQLHFTEYCPDWTDTIDAVDTGVWAGKNNRN